MLLLSSLCAAESSFGMAQVNVESAILRNRVVVLDSISLKKALYVAFSINAMQGLHGRIQVRGRLTRSGALVAEAFSALTGPRERGGNLVFDIAYEMPLGDYVVSIDAYNDAGDDFASGTRTFNRVELRSDAAPARHEKAAKLVEVQPPTEAEDPRVDKTLRSRGFVLFTRSALSYVYRQSKPQQHELIQRLHGQAVRNSSVALNFSLYSERDFGKLSVSASDLRNGEAVLSKNLIQVACVEAVPDRSGMPNGQYRMLPTLLRPLGTAQRIGLGCRRVWLTVAVPQDAVSGTYTGTISVAPEHGATASLPLTLDVAPVTLEDVPGMDYCMLMTYEFVELTMPWSEEQKKKIYDAATRILKDYKRIGMTTLCLHSPFVLLTRTDGLPVLDDIYAALRAARDVGFSRPIVWYMGHLIQTAKPKHPGNIRLFDESTHIARLKQIVATVSEYAKQNRLPEVVFLPIDEPDDAYQDVQNKRALLAPQLVRAIKEAGGKSMITAERYSQSGRPDYLASVSLIPEERNAAHDGGARYWRYENRVTMACDSPAYARYQYGIYAWKNGVDGMSSWTFQNTQNAGGFPGDAGSSGSDVYLAYPAPAGPLATIKWEAIREGIEDRKLIYQLEKRIARMKSHGQDTKRYGEFLARLKRTDLESCCHSVSCQPTDISLLDRQRQAVIKMILLAEKQ